jgi:GAF domain-containing protein
VGRRATGPKRRTAITPRRKKDSAVNAARPSYAELEKKVVQVTLELKESLQQQTATSDVLKVISRSPTDVQPVFDIIGERAMRLCEADVSVVTRAEGELIHLVSLHGIAKGGVEAVRRVFPMQLSAETISARAIRAGAVVHVPDVLADPQYETKGAAQAGGYRGCLGVPMVCERQVIGAIFVAHREPGFFADTRVELLKTFADQAVIAIENTRLFKEVQARTRDLSESLEQQTATSEVLRVISSSTGDLQPVFDAMLANATRLCEASYGGMFLSEGEAFRIAALHGDRSADYMDQWQQGVLFQPHPDVPIARAARTRKAVHVADLREDPAYHSGDPLAVAAVDVAGFRTLVAIPMLKENELLGAISIYRREVRPFTAKQIELVGSFAAQAVIAIENARLLNELRESLQQQTATADVLKVISRSTFDLKVVLEALIESAVRLCHADKGSFRLARGEFFHHAASYGYSAEQDRYMDAYPVPAEGNRGSIVGRVLDEGGAVQVEDTTADPEFKLTNVPGFENIQTTLGVPLLREGRPIGVLVLMRSRIERFSEKQVELVTTFANQAVIAVENARLFEAEQQRTRDLSQALEQQTATSEVLKVISSSPGELAPVFEAILTNATQICEAEFGTLTRVVDGIPQLMFQLNVPAALEEFWRRETPRPSSRSAISRVITTGQIVHVADLQAYEAYSDGDPLAVAGVELGGIRTLLVVPMLKDGTTFGTIGIYRQEVRPFTDKQIELVSNFAAQAAIAIENTRLLNELRQRTDDLSKSLDDLRAAQDRLVQTEKLASLGQLTAGIAHEIKNPLNFVNNFSSVSVELIDELQDALRDAPLTEEARAEINELSGTLRGNLDKIAQHGKRADSIVKNMLLHSREGSGERRLVDINGLVEESLNLAYHGARAEKHGFNITLERSFDPAAGEVDLFPQEITRVLLNLISNGFYATAKRKAEGNGGVYEPIMAASTRSLGGHVEIRIRDNGTGIPPEVKQKMFNPFFTTKPAGEGTGLGLSLSHDIIVKQHGGSIEVDTQLGEFTEFRIVLPRGAAPIAKSGERN